MSPETLNALSTALKKATKPDLGVTHQVVEITPDLAKKMLSANENIRALKQKKLAQYATDFQQGNWRFTGESVIFDRDGKLRNGQHRLTACVDTEIPFVSLVVVGVDPAAIRNMDTGAKRGLDDYLRVEGFDDAKNLAASINVAYQLDVIRKVTQETFSHDTLMDWFMGTGNGSGTHLGLVEDLRAVRKWPAKEITGLTPSVMAPIRHMADGVFDIEDVDGFFAALYYSGDITNPRSSTRWLREYLLKRQGKDTASGRMQRPMVVAMTIKALNLYVEGAELLSVNKLLWKSGGQSPEEFPQIGTAEQATVREMSEGGEKGGAS